ncbi:hypothetical protein JCM31185_13810 [Furfurilactobacillus curtus]|uniref:Phage shock protein PspC N-terminal domain-containing protein n=1 Tax=Furfurilactobacillus curtus TaxID=1746200 RepID=A0ABQ5JNG7_9LACO
MINVAREKLTKSATDRWIGGVFGGLGRFLHINPTILRIGYLLLALFLPPHGLITLLAVVLYGVLLWWMPSDQRTSDASVFNLFGDLFSGQNRPKDSPRPRGRKEIHAEEHDVHDHRER